MIGEASFFGLYLPWVMVLAACALPATWAVRRLLAVTGFYRWEVYVKTTAGDLLLPIGYASSTPVPVQEYLATHPQ